MLTKIIFLLTSSALAHILELTSKNKPKKNLAGFQFNVVQFYDETESGLESLDIFTRAHEIFESKNLQRSIGWAQIDLVRYPDLAFKTVENLAAPSRYIMGMGYLKELELAKSKHQPKEQKA